MDDDDFGDFEEQNEFVQDFGSFPLPTTSEDAPSDPAIISKQEPESITPTTAAAVVFIDPQPIQEYEEPLNMIENQLSYKDLPITQKDIFKKSFPMTSALEYVFDIPEFINTEKDDEKNSNIINLNNQFPVEKLLSKFI